MKKILLSAIAGTTLFAPAFAGEITSIHGVSTQLEVGALSVKNERGASSVSTSGENVSLGTIGTVGAGTAGTGAATTANATIAIVTAGAGFNYTSSAFAGSSSSAMTPTSTDAVLTALGAADTQTVTSGGVKGTLAGTNLATGEATITAGGAGTTATVTRSFTLSAFN